MEGFGAAAKTHAAVGAMLGRLQPHLVAIERRRPVGIGCIERDVGEPGITRHGDGSYMMMLTEPCGRRASIARVAVLAAMRKPAPSRRSTYSLRPG